MTFNIDNAIERALEPTATDRGGQFWDLYQQCPRKFHLSQTIEPVAEVRPAYFAIGSLCHSVLRFSAESVMAGRNCSDWEKVLEACTKAPWSYSESDREEAWRLMEHYFNTYGIENAGYPAEAKLIAVEHEWRAHVINEEVSARTDLLLEMYGETYIVDHKTRSSKFPDSFIKDSQTRPQFMRLGWLGRKHLGKNCPIWVNGIVKTKLPSFARFEVRIEDWMLDAWYENMKLVETQMRAGKFDPYADLQPRIMNISACSGDFSPCTFRDYCWGSEEVRELKYKHKEVKT